MQAPPPPRPPGYGPLPARQLGRVPAPLLLVQGPPDQELLAHVVEEGAHHPPPGRRVALQQLQAHLQVAEPGVRPRADPQLGALHHPLVEGGQPHPGRQPEAVLLSAQIDRLHVEPGADRLLPVLGPELGLEGGQPQGLAPRQGEGQGHLEAVPLEAGGQAPAALDPGGADASGEMRGIEGRGGHQQHHGSEGEDRRQGRVVQLQPLQPAPVPQELGRRLPEEVPGHGAHHPQGHGLGHEQPAHVGRRQADGVEGADLAGALPHGAEHGVEDDEGGDQQRHRQPGQARDRGGAHGVDQQAPPLQAAEEVQVEGAGQLLQVPPDLLAAPAEADAHRGQARPLPAHQGREGQDQRRVAGQVGEDEGLPAVAADLGLARLLGLRVQRRQGLAVEVGAVQGVRGEQARHAEDLAEDAHPASSSPPAVIPGNRPAPPAAGTRPPPPGAASARQPGPPQASLGPPR